VVIGNGIQDGTERPHIRVNDLWLAAQAVQRDFRVLTANAKDFADMPGLQMVVLKCRRHDKSSSRSSRRRCRTER